ARPPATRAVTATAEAASRRDRSRRWVTTLRTRGLLDGTGGARCASPYLRVRGPAGCSGRPRQSRWAVTSCALPRHGPFITRASPRDGDRLGARQPLPP